VTQKCSLKVTGREQFVSAYLETRPLNPTYVFTHLFAVVSYLEVEKIIQGYKGAATRPRREESWYISLNGVEELKQWMVTIKRAVMELRRTASSTHSHDPDATTTGASAKNILPSLSDGSRASWSPEQQLMTASPWSASDTRSSGSGSSGASRPPSVFSTSLPGARSFSISSPVLVHSSSEPFVLLQSDGFPDGLPPLREVESSLEPVGPRPKTAPARPRRLAASVQYHNRGGPVSMEDFDLRAEGNPIGVSQSSSECSSITSSGKFSSSSHRKAWLPSPSLPPPNSPLPLLPPPTHPLPPLPPSTEAAILAPSYVGERARLLSLPMSPQTGHVPFTPSTRCPRTSSPMMMSTVSAGQEIRPPARFTMFPAPPPRPNVLRRPRTAPTPDVARGTPRRGFL
jgi:hypothetical protein